MHASLPPWFGMSMWWAGHPFSSEKVPFNMMIDLMRSSLSVHQRD
jgi:hypothetical protein